jgi:hypothetical protein
MAYQNTFYKIVDKLINKLTQNGFKQVSYGTEKDLDLSKRQSNYPLAHIVVPNGSNDIKMTSLSFIIIVADKVDKTGNEYIEYGKDNTIDIQQDLLVRTQTTLKAIDKRFLDTYDSLEIGYSLSNTTFDSFKEDYPEILTGFIFSTNIEIPNMIDDLACEDYSISGVPSRPQGFGTSGTDGTSGINGHQVVQAHQVQMEHQVHLV